MADIIDTVKGKIVSYDERRGVFTIECPYTDINTLIRRDYREVQVTFTDSRPLSSKQRRSCYAMLREISEWSGESPSEVKEIMKLDFWTSELWQTADSLFSLSNAPMSIVAAFQSWLASFIVRNDIPTRRPMLEYIDDVEPYVYACLGAKKCCICGKKADLHHIERVGMGRNRNDIIHEGMEVLPLCREHHTEAHTMPDGDFFSKYHLNGGIRLDKTLCKIYGLKAKKGK